MSLDRQLKPAGGGSEVIAGPIRDLGSNSLASGPANSGKRDQLGEARRLRSASVFFRQVGAVHPDGAHAKCVSAHHIPTIGGNKYNLARCHPKKVACEPIDFRTRFVNTE